MSTIRRTNTYHGGASCNGGVSAAAGSGYSTSMVTNGNGGSPTQSIIISDNRWGTAALLKMENSIL